MTDLEDLYLQFPRLRESDHKVTSTDTDSYNCVGWVHNDVEHYWDPDHHWPQAVDASDDSEDDLASYLDLFKWMGFEPCEDGSLEDGYLKIAVYSVEHAALGQAKREFTHVARQLPSGRWSSKGGVLQDFRHELDALEESGVLKRSKVSDYLRRKDDGSHPLTRAAEEGLIDLHGEVSAAGGGEDA